MKRILFFTAITIFSFLLFCNSKEDQTLNSLEPEATILPLAATVVPEEKPKKEIKKKKPFKKKYKFAIGQQIDQLNGIPVYFNGETLHSQGRNKSADGYNYSLKWQCVEFIKRYYYCL